MLDEKIKIQLRELFSELASNYTLLVELPPQHEKGAEMMNLLADVAECSPRIKVEQVDGEDLKLSIVKGEVISGILKFRKYLMQL